MLKKSASGVLTSLRGSTYRSVRLPSSLAAVLLDGLFEHPVKLRPSTGRRKLATPFAVQMCGFEHSSPLPAAYAAAQQERCPNGALITLREPPSPGPKMEHRPKGRRKDQIRRAGSRAVPLLAQRAASEGPRWTRAVWPSPATCPKSSTGPRGEKVYEKDRMESVRSMRTVGDSPQPLTFTYRQIENLKWRMYV